MASNISYLCDFIIRYSLNKLLFMIFKIKIINSNHNHYSSILDILVVFKYKILLLR